MRLLIKLLPLFLFCFVLACGKAKDDKNTASPNNGPGEINQNETIMADGSNINGIYATDLVPLNKNIHMKKTGAAAVQRDGDVFSVTVKMKSGQRATEFKQAIYTGRRCPNIKDDLNKDAYVDINEAMVAIGKIVIPLDANLDSQFAGNNVYPAGDEIAGSFFYKTTASFARMFADLKTPDEDINDNIIKLGAEEGLSFPGRIIMLQGINKDVYIPETVATNEEGNVHQMTPVACGVLWKVEKMPEELLTTTPFRLN